MVSAKQVSWVRCHTEVPGTAFPDSETKLNQLETSQPCLHRPPVAINELAAHRFATQTLLRCFCIFYYENGEGKPGALRPPHGYIRADQWVSVRLLYRGTADIIWIPVCGVCCVLTAFRVKGLRCHGLQKHRETARSTAASVWPSLWLDLKRCNKQETPNSLKAELLGPENRMARVGQNWCSAKKCNRIFASFDLRIHKIHRRIRNIHALILLISSLFPLFSLFSLLTWVFKPRWSKQYLLQQ